MQPETLLMIRDQGEGLGSELAKGDVLGVARLAGIMAAKRTSDLIPLCHPLPLDSVDLSLTCQGVDEVLIEARVRTVGRTGVEMEALTAVSVAALAVYDMCKAVDKSMFIRDTRLVEKRGGTSDDYVAAESEA
jgi:cyclic pyranopterin phosphate synthase